MLKTTSPCREAFTLVEFLAVIAIIGILIALLCRRSRRPVRLPQDASA